jgi:hypothetical protein
MLVRSSVNWFVFCPHTGLLLTSQKQETNLLQVESQPYCFKGTVSRDSVLSYKNRPFQSYGR